jgi:hypothetical protein
VNSFSSAFSAKVCAVCKAFEAMGKLLSG